MEELKWADRLYIGDAIGEGSEEVIRKLKAGKLPVPSVFLITEACNPANQMEILESRHLSQAVIRRHLGTIYGVTASKGEAIAYIEALADRCMRETGSADLGTYIKKVTSR